ncbi:putative Fe-Mo cluster-binding protein, NifX family [Halanaeroarchaeum sp. HSR-CO]|uniref:NifB/NifX family molybdenum-iron cluster-binding protein n=1 Tax=Halanaeroarchaeum sp. HSR-CO TaxID=2866382 RepID=UPI00217D8222|nr:NifB/NifX family molybdenum-iron cluster-binding protein [Halanaeroarchaeum sp. HSR-CO]UWG47122.1 putative Fe-Mo cluster-binding protein, NifX family [Halanaeroarchaeum sp. HSR-CO]
MRACVPTTSDDGATAELSGHFGQAPYYTIVDTETDAVDVIANRSDHRGGSKLPPTYVAEHDVDAVLVTEVGKRGMRLFDDYGIDVFQSEEGTVEEIVDRFRNDELAVFEYEDAHGHGRGEHDHEH